MRLTLKTLAAFVAFSFIFVLISMLCTHGAIAADASLSPQDFFSQVLAAIDSFGGLSWVLRIAGAITLIISSMKVSFFNKWIWSHLGAAQAWVAPILGLAAGILAYAGGGSFSLPGLFAYLSAGAGALILHELLDTVKALPGLGPIWVSLINVIEGALGGPAAQAQASVAPQPPKAS